jgi:hypothetical protein
MRHPRLLQAFSLFEEVEEALLHDLTRGIILDGARGGRSGCCHSSKVSRWTTTKYGGSAA